MVVLINNAVDASRNLQSFDVGPKAGCKIVTESRLLRLVKQPSIVEILECVFRNRDADHGFPMIPFTDSQSRSSAAPSRTLARRRSKRSFC